MSKLGFSDKNTRRSSNETVCNSTYYSSSNQGSSSLNDKLMDNSPSTSSSSCSTVISNKTNTNKYQYEQIQFKSLNISRKETDKYYYRSTYSQLRNNTNQISKRRDINYTRNYSRRHSFQQPDTKRHCRRENHSRSSSSDRHFNDRKNSSPTRKEHLHNTSEHKETTLVKLRVPSSKSHIKCKEYYEKGLCLRGALCQFDHGTNPIVLNDLDSWNSSSVHSSNQQNLNGMEKIEDFNKALEEIPASIIYHQKKIPKTQHSTRQHSNSVFKNEKSHTSTFTNGETEYALAFNFRLDDSSSDSEDETPAWIRSAPDELYYNKSTKGDVVATPRGIKIIKKFEEKLLHHISELRIEAETLGERYMTELNENISNKSSPSSSKSTHQNIDELEEGEQVSSSCSSSDGSNSDSSNSSTSSSTSTNSDEKKDKVFKKRSRKNRTDKANEELQRRKQHPRRLHEELWHNDPGLMNDGPVCRCSPKAKRFGIRHGFYPGEMNVSTCMKMSNNSSTLYHYRVTVSPLKNFIIDKPTIINHDGHEYKFDGFSLLSHYQINLKDLPPCAVIRFNIRYDISIVEEKQLETFCVSELDLFTKYLFTELLELVDLKLALDSESCMHYHILPRFARTLPRNGKELLSMTRVLQYLLKNDKDVLQESELQLYYSLDQQSWQKFADQHKGTIVAKWGMKPAALRVDQIDRNIDVHEYDGEGIPYPVIVHFGIRPPQLSYAGNIEYQRCWRNYVKYRHLLSNMPKPTSEDRRKLTDKEVKLQEMRTKASMKRDVTIAVSSKGFRTTGLSCDIIQHAMLIPVLIGHLRFHRSLSRLEEKIGYNFKARYLLQLALTHPSYRENFGTNPDHARNALTNCGIRQPEYGDRTIHYDTTRKRGINTLISIMSKFGENEETQSGITHNERLEFLGDAVVEFITSIHLFHLFPDLEEGGLATYRAAIVQNQHLALLAQHLGLDQFMLYAHGSDLCHDSELRHAMANCFEALLGAIFLDAGIEIADTIFANTLFTDNEFLRSRWIDYPKHPLQLQEPEGDRHWVSTHTALQNLVEFEKSIGIQFTHIRLLARAFTDRSLGYTNLACGSNQRLEFLGDTVLQLIASEYLYKFFPDHHEGHLSLLRSSLVNNRTQAQVCDELGMSKYIMRSDPKSELKSKDRADLLESFLGALYVDKGLAPCIVFCKVCFIPRLTKSIVSQEWNDPKSKLQQCCLTLRTMNGREPDIPVYKVIESLGPTNTRIYIVAVYFRGKRLACGGGHSIQDAEMCAAASALEQSGKLFPQLRHQKRVLKQSTKKGIPHHQKRMYEESFIKDKDRSC